MWGPSGLQPRLHPDGLPAPACPAPGSLDLQLLGFARATSDGALSAVIWDVSVAPAWQRGGLGRALVERLTASLVHDGIATITLYAGAWGWVGLGCLAAAALVRLGLVRRAGGGCAM